MRWVNIETKLSRDRRIHISLHIPPAPYLSDTVKKKVSCRLAWVVCQITVVDRPYLFHADVFFEDVDGVGLTVHEDVRD